MNVPHPGSLSSVRLAPAWHQSCRAARTVFSTWFKVLDVRHAGTIPRSLSAFSQGRFNIDPSVIRVPYTFCLRFLTKRARRSTISTGKTFFENLPKHPCPLTLGGNCSEHRTRHHSHSTPSAFNRYGGLVVCPMIPRAVVTIRSSELASRTTLWQCRHESNDSRIDSSSIEGSHRSRMLSGRDTIPVKTILGSSVRTLSSTSWPVRYSLPGIFFPYRNAAKILFAVIRLQPSSTLTKSSDRRVQKPAFSPLIKSQREVMMRGQLKSERAGSVELGPRPSQFYHLPILTS